VAKPLTVGQAAALAAAKGRAKAATNAARKAVQQLAAAESEFHTVADRRVRTTNDANALHELLLLTLQNHDEIDVVLLTTTKPKPHPGQGDNP
jgi:hypothetical protein